MDEVKTLLDFWNNGYASQEAYDGRGSMGSDYLDGLLAELARRGKVLDFGCGSGWASLRIAELGCKNVVGLDASENAVRVCRGSAALSGFESETEFICGSEADLKTAEYDGCFSCNTLDVVPQEVCEDILAALARALKPGALFVLTLNAYMEPERLEQMGMVKLRERHYARDGVLRCVNRTAEEWKELTSRYFECAECAEFRFPQEPEWYHRRLLKLIRK